MIIFEGNENVSPIDSNDEMMIGLSYEMLMDICIANATYGKGKQKYPWYTIKDALIEDLKNHIDMVVENTLEEFELCADGMVKEMERRYENV